MTESILQATALTKVFRSTRRGRPPVTAVNRVSFSLSRGQVLALVGESGSGKTTIGRMLTGIEAPTDGKMEWEGTAATNVRVDKRVNQRVQMVFQDPYAALNPFNTIEYTLTRPVVNFLGANRLTASDRVRELLETVRLTPANSYLNKRPHELSGGQRQRVVIARALAAAPDVIIADEPVSMLDVSIRAEVLRLLYDLLQDRRVESMLYITHDLLSAKLLADQVMVLYKGHTVEMGATDDILGDPIHPYTRLLLSSIPNPRMRQSKTIAASYEPVKTESRITEGCPFAPRCPLVMAICWDERPKLDMNSSGRSVACHAVGNP